MKRTTRALAVAAITTLFAGMLMTGTASAANVLCDPSFEAPDACWTPILFTPGGETISTTVAHTGSRSAQFCGFSPCTGAYHQNYTIPSGVTSGTLSIWVYSDNPDGVADCDDFAVVQISTVDGANFETAGQCSESVPAGVWTQYTTDVTNFLQANGGQTIDVFAGGVSGSDPTTGGTDDGVSTLWYVDDVSLDVTTGSGPTTHPRTITLNLRRHLIAKGALTTDGYGPCVAGVAVKIQKRSAGRWRTIKSTTTTDLGTYRVRLRDRTGKYRAKAPAFEPAAGHICGGTRSTAKVHRH